MNKSANDKEFDDMVDVCSAAHEAVMKHGTPEMQVFMKALLHALAKEVIRRSSAEGDRYDA